MNETQNRNKERIKLDCNSTSLSTEKIEVMNATRQLDSLSEEERRALRRSRFSAPPPLPPHNSKPRLAHPGGPVATNKAVALAKFLQRKLQDPGGSASLDPDLVERAVQDAKIALRADSNSKSIKRIRHVNSFSDDIEGTEALEYKKPDVELGKPIKSKKKKQKKKKKGILKS